MASIDPLLERQHREMRMKAARLKLEQLKAKEEELKSIISDENQTAEARKQAEAELADVRKEIDEKERKLKDLNDKH